MMPMRKYLLIGAVLSCVGAVSSVLGDGPATAPAPAPDASSDQSAPSLPHAPLVIQADDVRPHVEFLASPAMQGRSGDEAVAAANFIRAQFEACGLKPLFGGETWFQEIEGVAQDGEATPVIGRNVGGWIEGSDPDLRDEFVILSAHYDHLGLRNGRVHPGADDNASGVSMLLEAAERFASLDAPPRRSMVFLGFDLEERMLWGSQWFAAHPPWDLEQVKLFITADMIGRSLGDLPLPTVFMLGSEHAPRLKETLAAVGPPEGLEVAQIGIDLIGTRSDYGPFRDREIPFLFFSTGEHPDYHTPGDTTDRIDYEKLARISSLIYAVAARVANENQTPEWVDNPVADLEECRAVHRITTLLLDAEQQGEVVLSDTQRFFVSQVQSKTGFVVRRGTISADERKWLVRMTQVLMLSVF